ncbi:putative Cytochrome b561 domain-containing protein [Seiridium cardinale]
MAPTDALSAPGAVSYSSDNLVVGDGTWDFTKNDFLLPNLMGLPFETMQYNGMGNRFSTLTQYHQLITGHGVLAAIVFLFIIPLAVMMARFHRGPPGRAVKYHAYLQILAVGLTTVVFILGFFAVGPNRSLTNPHHGIGVAIYTLILLQAIGGRFIRHIRQRSLRVMIHQWNGRAIALLGIAQVPLGLTLYGSPKWTFILYAIWMGFLLLLYFILSWRREKHRDDVYVHGGRSVPGGTEISVSERREEHRGRGWLGPLAAGAGIAALWNGRKNRKERERSRSRSRSRSHVRSGSRPPEVLSSRRGSPSYLEKVEYSERTEPPKNGGFMNKLLGVAGLLGAGAFAKRQIDKRETRRYRDEEYSAVATETPSKSDRRSRLKRPARSQYTESEFTDSMTDIRGDDRHGGPVAAAAALSAAEPRPTRPITPRPSHHRRPTESRLDSVFSSDYSSYVSPSRRAREEREKSGAGKGILAGLGLGWLAAKMKARKDRRAEDERLQYEDERRDGRHGSRLTGDGYGSPRRPSGRRPPRPAGTITTMTGDSEFSSVEPRPAGASSAGPPMPPLGPAGHGPVPIRPVAGESVTHHDTVITPVDMPPIPGDPHGILHRSSSGSESYMSAGGHPHRRHSSRRRRAGESAAAAAAASASVLAAETEVDRHRRDQSHSRAPSQPVSVKVKYHDDRDRNITLRRLTEEEAAREHRRRRRSNSASSISGSDIGGSARRRRYRRDSSARRTGDELGSETLSPPAPAFAGGRRPAKDSAYYSGPPAGPSAAPMTPMHGNHTVSSVGSPGSYGEHSALSPSPSGPTGTDGGISAAERRRRRRLERRDQRPATGTVEFS